MRVHICSITYPFLTYRRFLTPQQQNTFENTVVNGEIAHTEQFLHLAKCFQLYSMIYFVMYAVNHHFNQLISKSSAADLLTPRGSALSVLNRFQFCTMGYLIEKGATSIIIL